MIFYDVTNYKFASLNFYLVSFKFYRSCDGGLTETETETEAETEPQGSKTETEIYKKKDQSSVMDNVKFLKY